MNIKALNETYNPIDSLSFYNSNPQLREFQNKIEELTINAFTKKELGQFLVRLQTRHALGTLFALTKENQDKLIKSITQIDKTGISAFEKAIRSEDLILDKLNQEELTDILSNINSEKIQVIEENDNKNKQIAENMLVRENETVGGALLKMDTSGYNCVFLLGENNKYIGAYSRESLIDKPSFLKLKEVEESRLIKDLSLNKNEGENFNKNEALDKMKKYNINALPMIDNNGHFYGAIAFLKIKEKTELGTSTIFALTQLSLSQMKGRI